MHERAEFLRRRIATYRRQLAGDPQIDSVRFFLAAIVADQRELDQIEEALRRTEPRD
jgi:hypothetical protein